MRVKIGPIWGQPHSNLSKDRQSAVPGKRWLGWRMTCIKGAIPQSISQYGTKVTYRIRITLLRLCRDYHYGGCRGDQTSNYPHENPITLGKNQMLVYFRVLNFRRCMLQDVPPSSRVNLCVRTYPGSDRRTAKCQVRHSFSTSN